MGQGRVRLNVLRVLDRCLEAAACLVLALLFATVLAGIVTRAAGNPLIWTDEGARFLMVWLAVLGWMIAGRRRAHVRIRYFQGLLPARMHRAVEAMIQVALAAFGLSVAWFSVALVRRNLSLEATSLPVSMAWLYVPLVPAGLVMAAQAGGELLASRHVGQRPGPLNEDAIE